MRLKKGYSPGNEGGMQEMLTYLKSYILNKLSEKQDSLTFDDVPTQNSKNPVKSGGTYNALAEKIGLSNIPGHVMNDGTIDQTQYEKSGVAESLVKDTVGWSGKNRLYVEPATYENAGVTHVVNDDGHITVSGELDSTVSYTAITTTLELKAGTYILSGRSASPLIYLHIYYAGTAVSVVNTENADGQEFTLNSDSTLKIESVCKGASGTSIPVTNIYPMIRKADIADASFEPYHATVDTGKADKVTNATSGHLAGLDSNGNLTDSGVSPTEEVTVEGNPVTFESPFEQDAKSVVVSVKPIQDLHGYDYPWVGGAGKNKMYCELQLPHDTGKGIVVTSDGNGGVYLNGTSTEGFILGNVFKTDALTGQSTFCKLASAEPSGLVYTGHWPNGDYYSAIAGFDTVGTDGYWEIGLYFPNSGIVCNNVHLTPMVIMGDAHDTDYAPYSNICPISGIDELEIPVTGKNLCEKTFRGFINAYYDGKKDITIDNDSESAVFYAHAGQTYCLSSSVTADRNVIGLVSTDNIVSGMPVLDTDSAVNNVWTATWTGWTVWYVITRASADFEATCQIELGSIPTEYEPYTEHTTTTPLPSTLYGGTVDVTNGVLTVTHGFIEYDGSSDEQWAAVDNSKRVKCIYPLPGNAEIINDPEVINPIKTNLFETVSAATTYAGTVGISILLGRIDVADGSMHMDVTNFKNMLQNTPMQLCYELATPIEIQLTPADVELLEGTNVLTTNGEKVAVTYKAGILATLGDIDDLNDKVKTKFDKKDVAKVEGANASKAYAVGDNMLRADGFYVVTQAIAQNAPITSNNTDKTTVGNELSNIRENINSPNYSSSELTSGVVETCDLNDYISFSFVEWKTDEDATGKLVYSSYVFPVSQLRSIISNRGYIKLQFAHTELQLSRTDSDLTMQIDSSQSEDYTITVFCQYKN